MHSHELSDVRLVPGSFVISIENFPRQHRDGGVTSGGRYNEGRSSIALQCVQCTCTQIQVPRMSGAHMQPFMLQAAQATD
jgi:hypothetical protein